MPYSDPVFLKYKILKVINLFMYKYSNKLLPILPFWNAWILWKISLICFFWFFDYIFSTVYGMVSKFFIFINSHQTYCITKSNPPCQLPDCQNAARKSFFDVIFTDFTWKSLFLGSNWVIIHTVYLRLWFFFAKTCLKTVKENLQNLGTLPSTVLKISQKNTE